MAAVFPAVYFFQGLVSEECAISDWRPEALSFRAEFRARGAEELAVLVTDAGGALLRAGQPVRLFSSVASALGSFQCTRGAAEAIVFRDSSLITVRADLPEGRHVLAECVFAAHEGVEPPAYASYFNSADVPSGAPPARAHRRAQVLQP